GAQRLPVHLDPVAVRVKALDRHLGRFIVPFRNGDAISLHAFHQRATSAGAAALKPACRNAGDGSTCPTGCRARPNPSASRMMTVPSSYSWAVAGSKPK